jgi:hypothetical protein
MPSMKIRITRRVREDVVSIMDKILEKESKMSGYSQTP